MANNVSLSGIFTLVLIACVAGGAFWYVEDQKQPKTINDFLKIGQEALNKQDPKTAGEIAVQAREAFPDDNRPLLLASAASSMNNKLEDAIEYLREPNKDAEFYLDCRVRLGVLQLAQGHVADGKESLKEALELDPINFDANAQMMRLLRIEGRNWEARPYLFRLWMQGKYSVLAGMTLATVDSVFIFEDEDKEFLELANGAHPQYPMLMLGQGILTAGRGDIDRGLRGIDDVLAVDPTQAEAVAQKGWILLANNRTADYKVWRKNLPAECLTHPLVWETLAVEAEAAGRVDEAMRCYWESLRLHPDRSRTSKNIARLLRIKGRNKDATPFSRRGRLLGELEEMLAAERPETDVAIKDMVDRMEELDRLPEAMAWCVLGIQQGMKEMKERFELIQKEWGDSVGTLANEKNPALSVDLSDFPLPEGIAVDYDPIRIFSGLDVVEEIREEYGEQTK
ncbi:hypothetical protein OAH18_01140 [bacterium]|nr:hypothetical protein [bacterium]